MFSAIFDMIFCIFGTISAIFFIYSYTTTIYNFKEYDPVISLRFNNMDFYVSTYMNIIWDILTGFFVIGAYFLFYKGFFPITTSFDISHYNVSIGPTDLLIFALTTLMVVDSFLKIGYHGIYKKLNAS